MEVRMLTTKRIIFQGKEKNVSNSWDAESLRDWQQLSFRDESFQGEEWPETGLERQKHAGLVRGFTLSLKAGAVHWDDRWPVSEKGPLAFTVKNNCRRQRQMWWDQLGSYCGNVGQSRWHLGLQDSGGWRFRNYLGNGCNGINVELGRWNMQEEGVRIPLRFLACAMCTVLLNRNGDYYISSLKIQKLSECLGHCPFHVMHFAQYQYSFRKPESELCALDNCSTEEWEELHNL